MSVASALLPKFVILLLEDKLPHKLVIIKGLLQVLHGSALNRVSLYVRLQGRTPTSTTSRYRRKRLSRKRDAAYPCTRSRTLNSSFQRRPSRATHHSCSMPVSVTMLSKATGTTSGVSPASKLTSMGESSSKASPKSSIRSPG